MIVLIVTRKKGEGRYYFALSQTNNNTPNKMRKPLSMGYLIPRLVISL
jgi:hypothetical protein